MSENTNRQVLVKKLPNGIPVEDDFEMGNSPIPDPIEGTFRARTMVLSLDPYVRAVMSGRHFYGAPKPGDVMRGRSVARVDASRHPQYREGDVVVMESGLQDYAISDGEDVHRADTGTAPVSTALGVLGMPGLTAYAALLGPAQIKEGETVLVSAASGAVGSMVGQIAKIKGCRAIGIVGSEDKCAWTQTEAGFDACLNRKTDDLHARLVELAPEGADIFFDNTGGDIQNLVMTKHLALNSRVILSGLITQYNLAEAPPGPNLGNLCKMRTTVFGFVVYDFEHMRERFLTDAKCWFAEGKIKFKEDMTDGIETAPAQFSKLMHGNNFGKTLVKVSD